MKQKGAHVVVDTQTSEWVCLHCGERRAPPPLPLLLKIWLKKLKGFLLLHQDCPAPKNSGKENG
jgi:hypothetical protein